MSEILNPGLERRGRPSLVTRWLGAVALRGATFAEVRAAPGALGQAALIVLAGGIGRGVGAFAEEGWPGLVGGSALAFVIWIIAAALVWAIGVHALRQEPGIAELLRTLGFAAAPLLGLGLCATLPADSARGLSLLLHAWATLAFAVAVREALGVTMRRALWICAIALGFALILLLASAVFLVDSVLID